MTMDILRVAERYTKLTRKTHTEYAGACPLCGGVDRFVVFVDDKPGWLCRGCSPDHRRSAIDLVMEKENMTYPEACQHLGIALDRERKDTWAKMIDGAWVHFPINATYDYVDEHGKLVYQVVRYTKDGTTKNFGQRHPDATMKTGWKQGTKGIELVPYRLPELRRAIERGEPVYIVEGEKAAAYVASCGFCATTNVGGAGMGAKIYSHDYCQYFRGARVVVAADNDANGAGQKHARMIAARLDGIAASVEVRLSGQWTEAKGQGLDDWLAQGGSIDNLPELDNEPAGEILNKYDDLAMSRFVGKRIRKTWRYNVKRKAWLHWNSTHWEYTEEQAIHIEIKGIIEEMPMHATASPEPQKYLSFIARFFSREKRASLIKDLESEDGIPITPQELDTHKDILAVRNGYIALRDGVLHRHDKNLLYTNSIACDYNPDATAPKWLALLNQVLPGGDTRDFMSRYLGYCITGESIDICALWYGYGANGKSTIANVVAGILGNDATQIDSSAIIGRSYGKSYDLAKLEGARLCQIPELPGGTLRSEDFKKLIDGGKLAIERKYEHPYDIRRTHSMIIHTNNLPRITDATDAPWRRLALVQFDVTIPPDGRIPDYDQVLLQEEMPGILAWLVAQAREFYSQGINVPQSIQASTQRYRDSEDSVADWISSCCIVNPDAWMPAAEAYANYCEYADQPLSKRKFSERIGRLAFIVSKTKKTYGKIVRCYIGIGLIESDDPPNEDEGNASHQSCVTSENAIAKPKNDEEHTKGNASHPHFRKLSGPSLHGEVSEKSETCVTFGGKAEDIQHCEAKKRGNATLLSCVTEKSSESFFQRTAAQEQEEMTALRAKVALLSPYRDMPLSERLASDLYTLDKAILIEIIELSEMRG